VVIPVSDVDRAKEFYGRLGWRLDVTPPGVVQNTPHGSGCSVQFGTNLTSAAPGSAKGYLIVSDIQAALDQLSAAGIQVNEVYHIGSGGRASGLDPDISPAAADYQAARVARLRSLPLAAVQSLIAAHQRGPLLGVFGEPRVNVLELNLALDQRP